MFFLGLILIVIVLVVVVILYIYSRILISMYAKDNQIFSLPTEGEFVPVMRGRDIYEWYYSIAGKALDENFNVVDRYDKDGNINVPKTYWHWRPARRINPIRYLLGVFFNTLFNVIWISLPPFSVLAYKFRWIKYDKKDDENTYEMIPRQEDVDSIFFRYPAYGLPITHAETGLGTRQELVKNAPPRVQVKTDFVFETETVNPHQALFGITGESTAGDWILTIVAELRERLRQWIGDNTFDDLVSYKGDHGGAPFVDIVKQVNESVMLRAGVQVNKVWLVNVDFQDKKLQESIERVFTAEQDVKVAIQTREKRKILADATQAEAKAQLYGEGEGYEKIAAVTGGREMYMAQQLGRVQVYAPGTSGIIFPTSPTPAAQPPEKKGDTKVEGS